MSGMRGRLKKSVSRDEVSSSSSSSTSSFSSDDDSDDSDGDLKPIKDYLSNRREVAKHLFKSVKMEKLRMMLPQVLKKMELSELEEWCASELCGMSKSRILSILNGTPMSGSSDTSDSDGSGPSLEIISDTEEWLTDDDPSVKQEPLSPGSRSKKLKTKRKTKPPGKIDPEKVKARKGKVRGNQELDNVKVKKEKEKTEPPKQEGESLLDLLELEMRARAIRALIRKEEDIIPNSDSALNNALKSTLNSVTNAKNKVGSADETLRTLAPMETSATLVEKIGEDEDVVLLVKPTPTIELISSDSESENLIERVNKKLENERTPEKNTTPETSANAPVITIDKSVSKPEPAKSVEIHKTPVITENPESTQSSATQQKITEASARSNESSEMGKQTFRKLKRRRQIRAKSDSLSEYLQATDVVLEVVNAKEKRCGTPEEGEVESSEETKIEEIEKQSNVEKKTVPQNDAKFGEYEEIIDLDDYPDDMYDIETEENIPPAEEKLEEKTEISKENPVDGEEEGEGSAETWATRYYQTDNVQSVIKESKIQSEIRKRLRERQRLSKLNNSPKETPKLNEDNDTKDKFKPTGSVGEYFALKCSTNAADSNLSPSQPSETKNNDEGQVNEQKALPVSVEEVIVPTSAAPSSPRNLSKDEVNESAIMPVTGDNQL